MGEANQVAHHHYHGGAPSPSGRQPRDRGLPIRMPQFPHCLARQLDHAVVDQEEAGQPVLADAAKLLVQPVPDPARHTSIAVPGGLQAHGLQPALGVMARRRRGVGEAVASGHVPFQVEAGAALCDAYAVDHGFRVGLEQRRQFVPALEPVLAVGLQAGAGLGQGTVETDGHQGIVQAGAAAVVVPGFVGGHAGHAAVVRQFPQASVALAVAVHQVLLQLQEDGIAPQPGNGLFHDPLGLPPAAGFDSGCQQAARGPGELDQAIAVRQFRQLPGRQPGCASLTVPMGLREQAAEGRVAVPGLRQQGDGAAVLPVLHHQIGAGDGLDAQAVGKTGELQGAAQVAGVGQAQGRLLQIGCLGQQFRDGGGTGMEGIPRVGAQLHIVLRHDSVVLPEPVSAL